MITSISSSRSPSITSGLFLALVFLLVFLPYGLVFGLNVKIIAFAVFVASFVPYLITSRDPLPLSDVIFLTGVSAFLGLWALIGVMNGQLDVTQSLHHLRDVASTVFIPWFSIFLIRRGLVRAESLITVVIYAVFAMSVTKLVLIAVPLLFGLPNTDIIEAMESAFGQGTFVTGGIAFDMFRMQFPADILAAFALFALLAPDVSGVRLGRITRLVILVVLLASGFIAFSRYIWFVFAVATFAAIIVQRNWKALVVTVLAALTIGVTFQDFFVPAAELRFDSVSTDISDEVRVQQSKALIEEFENRPILGKGIGTHAQAITRHDTLLYSYELQWLAFLMQFGIVGMIGILMLVGVSTRDLLIARHSAKLWISLLFLLWLLAGFTNPYMTTSFAGVTYALFMAMFYRMRAISPSCRSRPVSLVPSA